ncbi:hypothetical protein MW290_17505 [Aquincola tertiaricarbonis]|uniref:Uncharacterized protein n=1 Tax=Aquincola tertiaricarbonis TaxID=391953 RepID=A0ABY4SFV3_AQUTE|nr:hypothetical protein [Aquincola tertiaricarbonis]URI10782.1 hypothetical protein MW290_17505 [Aquincola tertiaricarbonis]
MLPQLRRKSPDPVRRLARPLPAVDRLLTATALHHGLILVTRNVRDVSDLGVQVLNPWE